jgi:hypothetical protein
VEPASYSFGPSLLDLAALLICPRDCGLTICPPARPEEFPVAKQPDVEAVRLLVEQFSALEDMVHVHFPEQFANRPFCPSGRRFPVRRIPSVVVAHRKIAVHKIKSSRTASTTMLIVSIRFIRHDWRFLVIYASASCSVRSSS